MRKFLFLFSLSSIFCGYAYAGNSNYCDYKDTLYFTNDTAPAGSNIIGEINISGDATIQNAGMTSFVIQGLCQGGHDNATAVVSVGTSTENSCTLTIVDGQNISDPIIQNISCTGNYTYTGITYDGFLTYHYKLHFATR